MMKESKGILLLLFIFAIGFMALFKPWIHNDGIGYFSWLRSVVIDGNLDVGNEIRYYLDGSWKFKIRILETGYTYCPYGIGSAILWLPFFLLAHLFVLLSSCLGFLIPADGYSAPYVWAISAGSALYGLGSLLLTFSLCRNWFKWEISVLAVMTAWLSGTLLFYMFCNPSMAHANDAFAYALFLFTWHRTRNSKSVWRGAAARGATLALCALIRQVNAVFVFFVMGEYIFDAIQKWKETRRVGEIKKEAVAIVAFCFAWWLIFSPQVLVWRVVFGGWIELNPYDFANEKFHWLDPQILKVLFSPNRGLVGWTPFIIPAMGGLFYFIQKNRRFSLLLLCNFVLQFYVIASWWVFDGMMGPGNRLFANMTPVFALGLAALLERMGKRFHVGVLAAVCSLFVFWNGIILARYASNDIPRWGEVAVDTLLLGQFKFVFHVVEKIFW